MWWPQEIWSECFLFSLLFKIFERVETNTYYYCTWDHERVPNCYNCKISGDFSRLNGHWQHCILYNFDACAFRDSLAKICSELAKGKYYIHIIYYTLNTFFTLLYCYWGFGQPNGEKYDEYYVHLNFNLPGFGTYTNVN